MKAKKQAAIKKLYDAQLYLISSGAYRTDAGDKAFHMLMEAERFVRCGFPSKLSWEWMGFTIPDPFIDTEPCWQHKTA